MRSDGEVEVILGLDGSPGPHTPYRRGGVPNGGTGAYWQTRHGEWAMRWICKCTIVIFAILYVVALALLVIGTFGLFGQERDPLSGVFLLPMGLPWNLLGGSALPETALVWVAIAAPAANLGLLMLLCRYLSRRAG